MPLCLSVANRCLSFTETAELMFTFQVSFPKVELYATNSAERMARVSVRDTQHRVRSLHAKDTVHALHSLAGLHAGNSKLLACSKNELIFLPTTPDDSSHSCSRGDNIP